MRTDSLVVPVGPDEEWEQGLREVLVRNGFQIGESAHFLLIHGDVPPAAKKGTVQIIVKSLEDLGLSDCPEYDDVVSQGILRGLRPLTAEESLRLRRALPDQPMNERIIVAMEELIGRDGMSEVFTVSHDPNGKWFGSVQTATLRTAKKLFAFAFRDAST